MGDRLQAALAANLLTLDRLQSQRYGAFITASPPNQITISVEVDTIGVSTRSQNESDSTERSA